MPSAYDQMSKNALRATFKKEHFDLSSTNLDLLFKKYHATNMFYRNTANKWNLAPESRLFYDIYVNDILNEIENDRKYMLSVELKNCRDLIQMEYMQKSPEFNKSFDKMRTYWHEILQQHAKCQRELAGHVNVSRDLIDVAEACFILYLYPEYAKVVENMLEYKQLTEPMRKAVEFGNNNKKQQKITNPKITPNMVIRQSWQVGRIK